MNTTTVNDTEIFEMMQLLMNEGMQGFPAVMTKMYNLAMQFERELHLGAGKYERSEDRRGYANGYDNASVFSVNLFRAHKSLIAHMYL